MIRQSAPTLRDAARGTVGAVTAPAPDTLRSVTAPDQPSPAPVALLLHECADGRWHVDLLIARTAAPIADDARVVPTWRCAVRPDEARSGATIELDSIDEHRALYLRLAESRELDRGRGRVTPLRRGVASRDGNRIGIRWENGGRSIWRISENGHTLTVEANALPESSAEGATTNSEGDQTS
jgi:hypothetical protein